MMVLTPEDKAQIIKDLSIVHLGKPLHFKASCELAIQFLAENIDSNEEANNVVYCSNCGNSQNRKSRFCPDCGKQMTNYK